MKTASIAHVCYVNNIPFITVCIIMSVTNYRIINFKNNCQKASQISAQFVNLILKSISHSNLL